MATVKFATRHRWFVRFYFWFMARLIFSTFGYYPSSPTFNWRYRRFGSKTAIFLSSIPLLDVGALQQYHWNVNAWDDGQVLKWKESHLGSCNAIAVAGAIFAGIGLTALQLEGMTNIHWSAQACCACSMILGVMSVTTATRQHVTIGMLNDPLTIRLWLSRGHPTFYNPRKSKRIDEEADEISFEEYERQTDKYSALKDYQNLPLESSISALKTLALPQHLLTAAVYVFIVGFGLYLLFSWIDGGANTQRWRNIFIAFLAAVLSYQIYDLTIRYARAGDEIKRDKEFGTNANAGFRTSMPLAHLQRKLSQIQRRAIVSQELTAKLLQLRSAIDELDQALATPRRRSRHAPSPTLQDDDAWETMDWVQEDLRRLHAAAQQRPHDTQPAELVRRVSEIQKSIDDWHELNYWPNAVPNASAQAAASTGSASAPASVPASPAREPQRRSNATEPPFPLSPGHDSYPAGPSGAACAPERVEVIEIIDADGIVTPLPPSNSRTRCRARSSAPREVQTPSRSRSRSRTL